MDTPVGENGLAADKKRVGALVLKIREDCIDFATSAGIEHSYLQPHRACSRFHVSQLSSGTRVSGNDTLDGSGKDTMIGGTGNDSYRSGYRCSRRR